MKRDWSQLPKELLGLIVERLILPDYIRFGAVCCSWRFVAAYKHHRPAPQLPWLLLSGDNPLKEVNEFYSASEKKLHHLYLPEALNKSICGSFQGWLIMTDSATNHFLLNPLTRLQIPLPSSPKQLEWGTLATSIFKAVMSASPSSPSCLIAAVFHYGIMAFCRPADDNWTLFADKRDFYYQDLIFHNGALYAVNDIGELRVFEFNTYPRCRTVLQPVVPYHLQCLVLPRHLVECNGELLLVLRVLKVDPAREPFELPCVNTTGFQIYMADLREKKWVAVKSLGDQMLFLELTYSLALKAAELEGFKGDCIYYKGGKDEGANVYEIQSRRIVPFAGRFYPNVWIVPTTWELEAESSKGRLLLS